MNQEVWGLVVRDQSGFYWVEADDGTIYRTRLRGRLMETAQTSDIAAIGDRVLVTPTLEEDGVSELTGIIETVAERRSAFSRAVRTTGKRGVGQAEREHVIIANATQAFLVFAAAQPTPNWQMLDRMLVAGESSHVDELIIVINKIDLVSEQELNAMVAPYQNMGYQTLFTSAMRQIGIGAVRERLRDQLSVFTGPSGVGKTSLLNCIQPGLGRAVKSVSNYSQEGMHTTRDSALVKLANGGYLADTPGIRQLQVWDVEPDELEAYFLDVVQYVHDCKFRNCSHVNEPGCAVRAAVEAGTISPRRYENFLRLREELRETYIVY